MSVAVEEQDGEGNPTRLLITDLGSDIPEITGQDSRITIVNLSGDVVWEFDRGGGILNGAHNAELNAAGDRMLISDSGNDRVLIIGYPDKTLLWDSSVDCTELDLSYPNDANFLPDGHLLITVRDDHWVIEVDPSLCNGTRDGEIVWSFGEEGVPRELSDYEDPFHLNAPHNADRLPNGHTIIADSGPIFSTSRVIEVDPDYPGWPNRIVWTYQQREDCTVKEVPDSKCPGLYWCRDADVECGDPACDTGLVILTGIHQTAAVWRDLREDPPPGRKTSWSTSITEPCKVSILRRRIYSKNGT